MNTNNQTKPCPYCAEIINVGEMQCPFCEVEFAQEPLHKSGPWQEPAAFRMANQTQDSNSSPVIVLVLLAVCGLIGCFIWNQLQVASPTPQPSSIASDAAPPSDQDRKALYVETLNALKTTPSPAIPDAYRIIATEAPELPGDAEAEAEALATNKQGTTYSSPSTYTPSYAAEGTYSGQAFGASTEREIASGKITRQQAEKAAATLDAMDKQRQMLERDGRYAEAAQYKRAIDNANYVMFQK